MTTTCEQYEYRCYIAAQCMSMLTTVAFTDLCYFLNVKPEDAKSVKVHGLTLPQMEALKTGMPSRVMDEMIGEVLK